MFNYSLNSNNNEMKNIFALQNKLNFIIKELNSLSNLYFVLLKTMIVRTIVKINIFDLALRIFKTHAENWKSNIWNIKIFWSGTQLNYLIPSKFPSALTTINFEYLNGDKKYE